MEDVLLSLSSDNTFSPHLCVTVYSVLLNANKNRKYIFYILDGGISKDNKCKIENSLEVFKPIYKIKYIKIDNKLFKDFIEIGHLKKQTYYRLLLPELLPKVNKIMYLDCDLVVCDDICNLWNVNIDDYYLAGVKEYYPEYEKKLINAFKLKNKNIFNGGVLVLNLEKMRKMNSTKRIFSLIKKNPENLMLADQDAMNVVFNNYWTKIPNFWNVPTYIFNCKNNKYIGMGADLFDEIKKNPKIVHFAGKKPWHSGFRHPYKNYYFDILEKTCFQDNKVKFSLREFCANTGYSIIVYIVNLLPESVYGWLYKTSRKHKILIKI